MYVSAACLGRLDAGVDAFDALVGVDGHYHVLGLLVLLENALDAAVGLARRVCGWRHTVTFGFESRKIINQLQRKKQKR